MLCNGVNFPLTQALSDTLTTVENNAICTYEDSQGIHRTSQKPSWLFPGFLFSMKFPVASQPSRLLPQLILPTPSLIILSKSRTPGQRAPISWWSSPIPTPARCQ